MDNNTNGTQTAHNTLIPSYIGRTIHPNNIVSPSYQRHAILTPAHALDSNLILENNPSTIKQQVSQVDTNYKPHTLYLDTIHIISNSMNAYRDKNVCNKSFQNHHKVKINCGTTNSKNPIRMGKNTMLSTSYLNTT